MPETAVLQTAEEILEVYGDMVLRTAYAMVKNRADAEDVLQDVFLSLVRTNPTFQSAEHQKAWLLRVTMNRCKSFLRSAWQQKTQGLDEAFPDTSFTQGTVLSQMARGRKMLKELLEGGQAHAQG